MGRVGGHTPSVNLKLALVALRSAAVMLKLWTFQKTAWTVSDPLFTSHFTLVMRPAAILSA